MRTMSKQTIGPHEQQRRDMREARYSAATKPANKREILTAVAEKLPPTTGKKPVKRKMKGGKR
jgi:hypothetical protein